MEKLDQQTIEQALRALNELLRQKDVTGEICVYGGAAMVLAFHARLSTRDLDAVFQPAAAIREAAAQVAEALNLRPDWLNDGVKGWLSPKGDVVADHLPQYSHLRLTRPTKEYLLAMKCLAARVAGLDSQGDRKDVLFLIRACGLTTAEEVLRIVEEYYPAHLIQPKTRFLVEEVMSEVLSGEA